MLVATKLFSRQTFWSRQNFCRDKYLTKGFVATSLLLSRQTHACRYKTRLLSRQKYACNLSDTHFCSDKHVFVTTNIYRDKSFAAIKIFCRLKHNFVTTKCLSRQAYFCRDKRCVLSQQTRVCHDKMILVATPANDSSGPVGPCLHSSGRQILIGDQHLHLASESRLWRVSVCTRSGLGQPLFRLFNNLDGGMG